MYTVKTEIKPLDKKLNGGLRGGSLTVIAGRPGIGKSSLAFQIAGNIAECGKRVLLFSFEMDELGLRKKMSKQGFEAYENNVIVYDEPAVNVEYITQKATSSEKIDAIFVDYIQLIQGKNNKLSSCKQEVEEIVSDLKYLAEKTNVPVIVVSQLSRNADGVTDIFPLVDSVRKAGFREQDTDIIIFLYLELFYNEPENYLMILGENKYGEIGIIPVRWNKEKGIFADRK